MSTPAGLFIDMSRINQLTRKWFLRVSGSKRSQNRLNKLAKSLHYYMGIGSGGGVTVSGERGIFHQLKTQCNAPYCVFDVGANAGQFLSLTLEELAGIECKLHSFEPSRSAFELLSQAHADHPSVTLNNFAMGRESGETTLYYDKPGSTMASLTKRDLDHFGRSFDESETIQIQTVDQYCESHQIDYIHLMKIDVEGHELDVLTGARQMLQQSAVGIVTFEFGGCNIDTRTFFRDFWQLFSDYNFNLFRITPSGYFAPIDSYKETDEQFITTNYACISRNLSNV